MKADLERRVHELLDAGRDPAEDSEVRSAMADDEDAREEVAALSKLEGWLRDWEVSVPNEDLEPIAQRIEQRLDQPMGSFDATAAPVFDDPDAKVSSLGGERGAVRSGEYSLDKLADAVDAPAPAMMTGPSPAVSLSAPPRPEPEGRPPLAPWIAAAAVVALGITVSVATLQRADEPAPAAQSAPSNEAMPGMLPASPEPPTGAAAPEEAAAELDEIEEASEEEAEPMEEVASADEAPAPAPTAAERSVGGSAGSARTRRRASMAAAMTTATARGALLDQATGGGAPASPQLEAEGEDPRQAVVERSKAAVRACLGAGSDSALVMVRFRDGAVRDARLVRPAGSDATNECVASALRRARLRPEGQQERRTLYYRWGGPSND